MVLFANCCNARDIIRPQLREKRFAAAATASTTVAPIAVATTTCCNCRITTGLGGTRLVCGACFPIPVSNFNYGCRFCAACSG
jgi:hypothetical protein